MLFLRTSLCNGSPPFCAGRGRLRALQRNALYTRATGSEMAAQEQSTVAAGSIQTERQRCHVSLIGTSLAAQNHWTVTLDQEQKEKLLYEVFDEYSDDPMPK